MDDAFLRTENALLRSRLAEAEIDQLQSQEERKELRRQIGELARGNVALQAKVQEYGAACARQVERLQGQLQERNNAASLLGSQREVLQESNATLAALLRSANARIIELTRELAERNRFIKEYIEKEGNQQL